MEKKKKIDAFLKANTHYQRVKITRIMLKDITILRNGLISRRAKGLYWRNKKKRKLDIKHNDVNETNTIGKRK